MYINEEIHRQMNIPMNANVRVIGDANEQIGIVTLATALDIAYNRDLDLCLVSAQSDTPVCRIMDYGKFCFERDKREKENKKKQQKVDIKEVQLSCQIDVNDFNTKVNHARRFLTDGNKVKVSIRFRGRQMAHQEIGAEMLAKFAEALAEVGTVDKKPILEGRNLTMFMTPIKK